MQEAPWKQFKLPNLVTFASLTVAVVGFYLSLRYSSLHWFAAALGVSSVLDIFDGKFASMFNRSPLDKEFGMQIDSLVDGTVFGAGPALLLIALNARPDLAGPNFLGVGLLAAGLFYLLCALVRLGFYNVYSAQDHRDFVGLPTTMTSVFWGVYLALWPSQNFATVALFVILGLFMIAPVRIPRPRMVGLIVICSVLLGFAALNVVKALESHGG